jgi:hypothetical protein
MSYKEKYVPKTLSEKDKKKQIKSIREKTDRPKLKSFETKRSPFVERFEKKYGFKITDKNKIAKSLMTMTGINKVLAKGRAAYYSSGSRPNQTRDSWAFARLASVLLFGKAANVDRNELLKYGKGEIKKEALKRYTHKMPDGTVMTGKKHDKNSIPLSKI